ncbi:MAG: hypothetical protein CL583_03845 [Alteromonadaceae bacterium]|nr:hypothetical protein [Alteromonadaceae bacterium]
MKGSKGSNGILASLTGVILVAGTVVSLAGCAAGAITGTTYAAGGAAATAAHRERQAFKKKLGKDYQEYQDLFAAASCDPDEYQIGPTIMESLEDSPPIKDGFEETQETLEKIYNNPEVERDVRAHALYLIALTEAEKEDGSRQKARKLLRQVKQEFPGTHDCAVDVLLERGRQITDDDASER